MGGILQSRKCSEHSSLRATGAFASSLNTRPVLGFDHLNFWKSRIQRAGVVHGCYFVRVWNDGDVFELEKFLLEFVWKDVHWA